MVSKNSKNGFTLIELIIVVVIIAILATFGITSFSRVRQQSRDEKRIADFNELVKLMKLYKLQTNTYPGDGDDSGARIGAGCTSDLVSDLINREYLENPMTDPLDNGDCADVEDTSYFYGFDDGHCCEASVCISINRLETQQAYDRLDKLYENRLTVYSGCDANIGGDCTTERQFHMCFVPN